MVCVRQVTVGGRKQPLVVHTDNSNAMFRATLESYLEELGVLRSLCRTKVYNDKR